MSIADLTQLITAIGVLLGIILTYLNSRKINTVHEAVNSTADAQNARVDQLTSALSEANVDVPPRPHHPTPAPPTTTP